MSGWEDPIGDLHRAVEAILNQPYPNCPHIVSSQALYRPGTYICMSCMQPVEVPYPLSEHIPVSESDVGPFACG